VPRCSGLPSHPNANCNLQLGSNVLLAGIEKFAVLTRKFPVLRNIFPASSSRELRKKSPRPSGFLRSTVLIGTVMSRLARARKAFGDAWRREAEVTKPVLQPLPAIKLRCLQKSDGRSAAQAFFAARSARRSRSIGHTPSWRREPREYIWTTAGLCNRAVPPSHKEECAVMDQERDREQLERKLEQCRRLSGAASDPTTSIRFAKLIEELEHSLREAE